MFGQFEEPHVDPWPMAGDIWGSSCNIQALGKHLDGGCQWENYKKWHWSLSFEHLNDDLSYAIISSIFHPFSSLSIHCSSICHPFFIHFFNFFSSILHPFFIHCPTNCTIISSLSHWKSQKKSQFFSWFSWLVTAAFFARRALGDLGDFGKSGASLLDAAFGSSWAGRNITKMVV